MAAHLKRQQGDIFHFEWQVDQSGYEIVSAAEDLPPPDPEVAEDGGLAEVERPVLDDPPIGGGWYIRRKGGPLSAYRPLESARGLARQFASLPEKTPKGKTVLRPQALLKFANEFGLLGVGLSEHPRDEDGRWWYDHVWGVRHVIQKIDDGKKKEMASAFTENVVPQLTVRIEVPLEGNPSLKVAPLNLLSAMWIQIAGEITDQTKFRRCLWCPKWFPHGPGTGHKATKRFCSDRCRKAWNRQRGKGC